MHSDRTVLPITAAESTLPRSPNRHLVLVAGAVRNVVLDVRVDYYSGLITAHRLSVQRGRRPFDPANAANATCKVGRGLEDA